MKEKGNAWQLKMMIYNYDFLLNKNIINRYTLQNIHYYEDH